MVEAVCACGQKQKAPENQLADISQCPCGRAICCVTAEELPEGSGIADFDARLIVTDGPAGVGQQILLGGCLDIELGKLAERHICLIGPKVSRLHAKLVRMDVGPSRWNLVDNNSTNGLFVNGERVTEHELKSGDVIQLGDYQLRYESTYQEPKVVKKGGKVCPSCQQELKRGTKICVTCGIYTDTGKPIVISKGVDENVIAVRANTWIRVASWFVWFGLFPIASEAYGTRKPIAIWSIAGLTLFCSLLYWGINMISKPEGELMNPQTMNLLLWAGSPQVTQERLADPNRHLTAQGIKLRDQTMKLLHNRFHHSSPADALLEQIALSNDPQAAMSEHFIEQGAEFHWYQLFTHALLHENLLHIAGNFVFLLVFGLGVNEMIGNLRMAILYPIFAVAAAGAYLFAMHNEPMLAMLGASGAIMGLAGMYFILFPVQKVHMAIWLRIPLILRVYKLWRMPGFWLLILWVGFNDLLPVVLGSKSHVAHAAHLGGFVTGMIAALLLLVTRQVNTRGSDILSVSLGPKAWKIIGKPNQWKDPEPIESIAAKSVSLNYPS